MSYIYTILSYEYNGFSYTFLDILSLFSILFGIYIITSKNPIVSVLFLIGLYITISGDLLLLGYNFLALSYLLVYVGAVSILFLFILMLINVRTSELFNDTSNNVPLVIFTGFFLGFPLYNTINNNIDNNININKAKNNINNTSDKINSMNIDNNIINKNIFNNEKKLIDTNKISSETIVHDFSEEENISKENILDDEKCTSTSASTIIHDFQLEDNLNYNNIILKKDIIDHIKFRDDYIQYTVSSTWDDNLIEFTDISSVGNNLYTTYGIWLIISSIILLLAMIGAITITKKDQLNNTYLIDSGKKF